MDIVLTLQEEIKLLKVEDSFHYEGGYNHGYQPTYTRRDDKVELVQEIIEDLWQEINMQMDNEVTRSDFKAILHGIKNTIINQLDKGNSRKWKKWQENALTQTQYQSNLDDYYNDFGVKTDYMKSINKNYEPNKAITSYTKYSNRPKKTLKWELIVREEIGIFIKKMMALNKNTEWGVAFTWIKDDDKKQIIIDKIYIMPVNVGGSHVDFVNESEFIIFAELSELGEFVTDIDNKTRFAGIMHSHHTMGSWHSSTDHGTIETYINDFKTVLSLVWAWKGDKDPISVDVILQDKKDSYLIKKISFDEEISSNDKDIVHIDSKLVDQYNTMIDIVTRDYPKYKSILNKFEDTKKFLSIERLYQAVIKEDNKCNNIEIIKELIV